MNERNDDEQFEVKFFNFSFDRPSKIHRQKLLFPPKSFTLHLRVVRRQENVPWSSLSLFLSQSIAERKRFAKTRRESSDTLITSVRASPSLDASSLRRLN